MARLVIAFGGNALIREDERGTWPEQTAHALEAARAIARMGRADEVVLTHGNGPQVGALAAAAGDRRAARAGAAARRPRRDDPGRDRLPAPAGARRRRPVAADRDDAHARAAWPRTTRRFAADPTKPIGAVLRRGRGAAPGAASAAGTSRPTPGRGWRRMVPSPRPLRILEVDHVRRLAEAGVARHRRRRRRHPGRVARRAARRARRRHRQGPLRGRAGRGAGGRPARARHRRAARGRSASARRRRARRCASRVSDALRHLEEGEFPPGSMGPEDRGRRALRRAAGGQRGDHRRRAPRRPRCAGTTGTWIVPDDDGPSVFAPAPVAA